MKKILNIRQGVLNGTLYLESLGYTYKIRGRINGKIYTLARSYTYILDKNVALNNMKMEMEVLSEQEPLFNLKDYNREI